ncbi:MAG: hypothetical protein AABY37_03180 [Actinomycetota bacterium]
MKRIIALITVASALVLTGCSQVGVAASVGSTKITQTTVQKSIDTVLAERAKVDTASMQLETGETLNRSQLRFHLISVLFGAIAKDAEITTTKAEIDSRRASIITQVGGESELPKALVGAGIASVDLDSYLDLIVVSEKLSQAMTTAGVDQNNIGVEIQKLVVAKADKLKVTVNPRYGKWDSAIGDVVAADAASSAATPATAP